ncbi:MAG: hypothetical protein O3A93_00815 [Chloroflexi bacterium]|nr:hypothetical protein [Chloroflexota bacterium]MDA1269789.1 hypothetical protein [Chloroflexota bacterium]
MDRAGKLAKQLSGVELEVIFRSVKRGDPQNLARQELEGRNRTTVNRAFNVVSEFQRRALDRIDDQIGGGIAAKAGYGATLRYVQTMFGKWTAWKRAPETRSEDQGQEENISHDPLADRTLMLLENMWVPEPDQVPIYFMEGGPGFREAEVNGRAFCWTQGIQERMSWDRRAKRQVGKEVLSVVKVWFADVEETEFYEVLRFLEESQGRQITDRYEELQRAMVDYVRRATEYKWGRVNNGLESISRIQAAELGGEKIDEENLYIAPGYALMEEHPRLRGLVEEFKRELRLIVISKTTPDSS